MELLDKMHGSFMTFVETELICKTEPIRTTEQLTEKKIISRP